MTFSQSIRTCLREKYVTFSGRASRSEYWWFQLFFWLVLVVAGGVVGGIVGAAGGFNTNDPTGGMMPIFIAVGLVYLALLLPTLSVGVRRLHDRDMSGWWLLGVIVGGQIPIAGFIISIVFLVVMCLKGTDGPNRFGPDPLKPGNADIFA